MLHEPIDGPVLVLVAVDSIDEAIALANAGDYGLGASVWTADRYQGLRIARELHAGMVWLNDHLPGPTVSRGPWGAAAGGGLGRTLGQAGLRACAQEKLITWDPPSMRGLWWGPYDATSTRARCAPSPSCARPASPTATARGAKAPFRSRAWGRGRLDGECRASRRCSTSTTTSCASAHRRERTLCRRRMRRRRGRTCAAPWEGRMRPSRPDRMRPGPTGVL